MDNVDDTIKEQFKQLPNKLQDFILAPNFEEKIKSISEGHPLDQIQSDAFENEVMLVLLHLEDINSFTVNVRHNVHVSRERADKLSRATTQKIFMPITEMLKYQEVSPQNIAKNDMAQDKSSGERTRGNANTPPATPQDLKPMENDMFHKKLTQQVHIPNEEERINLTEDGKKKEQKKPPQGYAEDPYREPID